jgi:hypothetical protein
MDTPDKPTRPWWHKKRCWAACAAGCYLLLLSPLCWAVRIYWDARTRHATPPAAQQLLLTAALPTAFLTAVIWPDNGFAAREPIRALGEQHRRRAAAEVSSN